MSGEQPASGAAPSTAEPKPEPAAPAQPTNGNQTISVLPPKPREALRVVDEGPLANLFDTARFEHLQRISQLIATSSLLPKHLWGFEDKYNLVEATANCFRIVNQAVRWGIDPFAAVDETYVVHGRLGYQGKLIAAVVNTKCGLASGLRYLYAGKKGTDDFACVCYGSDRPVTPEARELLLRYVRDDDMDALNALDELDVKAVRVSFGQAKTFEKDGKTVKGSWKDPEQKLSYNAATKWARRHSPEVILGVLTDDDLDRIALDVQTRGTDNPAMERVKERLAGISQALPQPSNAQPSERKPPAGGDATQEPSPDESTIQVNQAADQVEGKAPESPQGDAKAAPMPEGFDMILGGCWNKDQLMVAFRGAFPLGTTAGPDAVALLAREEDRIEDIPAGFLSQQCRDYLARFDRAKTEAGVQKLLDDAKKELWTPEQQELFLRAASKRFLEIGKK